SIYCGNAFFIVDSRWPKEYCNSSLERVKPDLIITDDPLENMSYEEINFCENMSYRILMTNNSKEKPQDLSYVITTSGTTGEPKVIEVCNSSIIPNIYDLRDILNLNSIDLIYQASSLTFDPSLIEIFCSFVSKCKLLILPQNVKQRPEILNNHLFKHHLTTLQ
ncbi:acyl- synthetase family member 4, partial [Brachionus plicatilis]